ncbi:PepSY domain-containing protein [Ectothiorhodospira shaposhnikovii]|uniref:PepSY domain-containing protein n=1 Tax=Ectothiorhodospira shaposhnikovii TaxID=1054 RepID=UPI0039A152B2
MQHSHRHRHALIPAKGSGWWLCLVLSLAFPVGAATLVEPSHPVLLLPVQEPSGEVSLDEAVALVQAGIGGRVLSAETQIQNGRRVHRIRILTDDQRVRNILVDAVTGEWR